MTQTNILRAFEGGIMYDKNWCHFNLWRVNPLTAGAAYIRVSIFYQHIKYHFLNMVKIKCDINQQYLKTVD